jgi:hypothetical protein
MIPRAPTLFRNEAPLEAALIDQLIELEVVASVTSTLLLRTRND